MGRILRFISWTSTSTSCITPVSYIMNIKRKVNIIIGTRRPLYSPTPRNSLRPRQRRSSWIYRVEVKDLRALEKYEIRSYTVYYGGLQTYWLDSWKQMLKPTRSSRLNNPKRILHFAAHCRDPAPESAINWALALPLDALLRNGKQNSGSVIYTRNKAQRWTSLEKVPESRGGVQLRQS